MRTEPPELAKEAPLPARTLREELLIVLSLSLLASAAFAIVSLLSAPLKGTTVAVYPQVGLQFVTLAYVVVVLGGLGDMAGAMLGSLIVAAVEVAGSYIFGAAWKEVFYFLLFIGVLVFRPAGLFGQRGAETLGA